jgi:hypothetical protein
VRPATTAADIAPRMKTNLMAVGADERNTASCAYSGNSLPICCQGRWFLYLGALFLVSLRCGALILKSSTICEHTNPGGF